ncbi:aminotransferase class V-fold PLP-dependent enzyme [Buchananella felis]|uniref:aminotransferase class V-fold PLP-dependent enzyme n=1 Tax=Buchananella felis TaxID=3231492 RepID=UPI003528B777
MIDAGLAEKRADFPALSEAPRGGERLVYLDWAATAQRPAAVMEAEERFLRTAYGAVNRGTHLLADRATTALEDARARVAAHLGARSGLEVSWTSGATGGLNFLAQSLTRAALSWRGGTVFALGPGDEVCVTPAEHHANLVPWQELCALTGAKLTWLGLTPQGRIDLDTLGVINPRTKMVAFTHASNVTGAVSPVEAIVAAARRVGAWTVLDACQSAAHGPLELDALGVDFAVASAHKICGPTGVGVLYGRAERRDLLPPPVFGGSMVTTVTMERSDYHEAPTGWEAGTQPVSQAVGWAAALDYLAGLGWDRLRAHERGVTAALVEAVSAVPGVRLLGPADTADRLPVVAFDVAGVHPHDVGQFLDAQGVAIRVGHHCAQPIHAHFKVRSSGRASGGPVTGMDDVEVFRAALSRVRPFFGVE